MSPEPPSARLLAAPRAQLIAVPKLRRYYRTGDSAALTEAIAVLRRGAEGSAGGTDAVRLALLATLAAALHASYQRTGDAGTLVEAVTAGREALELAERHHPDRRAQLLSNLAVIVGTDADRTGDPEAAREHIALIRAAVDSAGPRDHDRRALFLSNLAAAQVGLFEVTGDLGLLREATGALRAAVSETGPHADQRAVYLSNLGVALRELFEHTGDADALREAVEVSRRAVAATGPQDPARPARLAGLGMAQLYLFRITGDDDLLQEAVAVIRTALATTDSESARAMIWSSLSIALLSLFERTGDADDLREAVAAGRAAVAGLPDGGPLRNLYQANLAVTLSTLAERADDLGALLESAELLRSVVDATPEGHPDRPMRLSSLCATLHRLFSQTGDLETLTGAVAAGRASVAEVPADHSLRSTFLFNLGSALRDQFRQTGDVQALHEAVAVSRMAVQLMPAGHPDRAALLVNLGAALRFTAERDNDPEALAEAQRVLRETAGSVTAAIGTRIRAGTVEAGTDTMAGDFAAALAAMENVIGLLPMAAPRELTRRDRRRRLGAEGWIGAQAAACALDAGRPDRAVVLLEQARGLLMAEAMGSRSELSRLRAAAPDLADEFTRLTAELAALESTPGGSVGPTLTSGDRVGSTSGDRVGAAAFMDGGRSVGDRRRASAAAWDALLARIRARPELADFLAPAALESLREQADDGPIVIVTAHPTRCDALVLTSDPARPVLHVPLRGLTIDDAYREATAFIAARDVADPAGQDAAQREQHRILGWLWDTVAGPVLTALGYHGPPAPGAPWPRLWWCPVGVMAALPLHAAGHHQDLTARADAPRTALDRVVSSYTTTVRVLGYARQRARAEGDRTATGEKASTDQVRGDTRQRAHAAGDRAAPGEAALIVAMPDTPGEAALPGVRAEISRLTALMPACLVLEGAAATRDSVLAALPGHPVAHFACHALSADGDSADASRLIVTDDAARPLTVACISRLDLPQADLAYLSACSTAGPDLDGDEGGHVTAAFQLAGYRSVIGTLWPVQDRTASRVAAVVYAELTAGGVRSPATDGSALALHHAIRQLRAANLGSPVRWTAHVHVGV
jgi:tetratricopeptide (TPR) repeat protein